MADKPFAGIIFDLNGVLVWDNPLHEEAWRRFSAQLRGAPMTMEEMKHHVHGRVNLDIFTYVLGREVTADELRMLADEKEAIYRQLALEAGDAFRLSPGTANLLDYLAAAAIPRAIATSSPPVNIRFYVEQLQLARWFAPEHIIYDRGRYPGKPAPDIYLEAAGALGLPPERLVVVEDAPAGIESAQAAGIGAIVAIETTSPREDLLRQPGVTHVIRDLGEFPRKILAAQHQ